MHAHAPKEPPQGACGHCQPTPNPQAYATPCKIHVATMTMTNPSKATSHRAMARCTSSTNIASFSRPLRPHTRFIVQSTPFDAGMHLLVCSWVEVCALRHSQSLKSHDQKGHYFGVLPTSHSYRCEFRHCSPAAVRCTFWP